jgi:4-amino-4-deoxy-L-arabinose transferase-like glycosyltransferase
MLMRPAKGMVKSMGCENRSIPPVLPSKRTAFVLSLPAQRIALIILLLGMALLPRLLHLADFYTYDEAEHWPQRVLAFADALRTHDWAATNQTGHPGVTTMWLGALGSWLARSSPPDAPDAGAVYLAMLRFPLALVNALAVVFGYLLARRLVSEKVALLAGLLWAASPFLIAHSRVLHVDGLLTSGMSLSMLLLLCAAPPQPRATGTPQPAGGQASSLISIKWAALIGSGVCAGLALLTKSPALLLLPSAGLWLLWAAPELHWRQRLFATGLRFAAWLGVALLMVVALWPAMWVTPGAAIQSVYRELVTNGGQPHEDGSFFLGQPVADPGWLFYPLVVAWRSDPLTLIGLALLPLSLWRRAGERRILLALCGFALLFGAAMSVGPKKFDRYLLPIWPALELLAAAGLITVFELGGAHAARRWRTVSAHPGGILLRWLGGGAVCTALVSNWAMYHPYELAYFNPLLGGGAVGSRVLLVGWGEGLDLVGAWLRQRPDLAVGPVMARNPLALTPFVPIHVLDMTEVGFKQPVNYAVLYVSNVARREDLTAAAYIQQTKPLTSITIHGMTYATIYQLARPYTQPIDAVFDDSVHLRGINQSQVGSTLVITPSWDIQADRRYGLMYFMHVLSADGQRIAQVDTPIDGGIFASWQAGQQFGFPLRLVLPGAAAGMPYRIVLGVYDIGSGQRLPLTRGKRLPDSVDGAEVIEIAAKHSR